MFIKFLPNYIIFSRVWLLWDAKINSCVGKKKKFKKTLHIFQCSATHWSMLSEENNAWTRTTTITKKSAKIYFEAVVGVWCCSSMIVPVCLSMLCVCFVVVVAVYFVVCLIAFHSVHTYMVRRMSRKRKGVTIQEERHSSTLTLMNAYAFCRMLSCRLYLVNPLYLFPIDISIVLSVTWKKRKICILCCRLCGTLHTCVVRKTNTICITNVSRHSASVLFHFKRQQQKNAAAAALFLLEAERATDNARMSESETTIIINVKNCKRPQETKTTYHTQTFTHARL